MGQLCPSQEVLLSNHNFREASMIPAKREMPQQGCGPGQFRTVKVRYLPQPRRGRGLFQMLWSNGGQKEQVFLQSHFYLLQQALIQYEGRLVMLFGSNLVGRQLAQPPGTLGTGATSGRQPSSQHNRRGGCLFLYC